MKKTLCFTLALISLTSTSFASIGAAKTEFKFKFMDLDHKKVVFETKVKAADYDEALDKVAQDCFKQLRKNKVDGQEAIDICVNPRQG